MATASSASSIFMRRRLTEIIQCPICLEDCRNPKSLPCVHSFCDHCLKEMCKDLHFMDRQPCPVCRKNFIIGYRGVDDLPHNVVVQNLVDIKEALARRKDGANEMERAIYETQRLKVRSDYLNSPMNVVRTLSGHERVVGLALLNGELYVLRRKSFLQVSVHAAPHTSEQHPFRRRFTINGLRAHSDNDMTSSPRTNLIYVSSVTQKCIYGMRPNGELQSKWLLTYVPHGLSLTPSDDVLATCWDSRRLLEINAVRTHKVRLSSAAEGLLYHAVQLPASQLYLVAHARLGGGVMQVSAFDADGKVQLSYCPQASSSDDGDAQVGVPRHLAVDRDNFVVFADCLNSSLVVLSPSLQLVRQVRLDKEPWRLMLDHATRRLYVGYHNSGDVTVLQI